MDKEESQRQYVPEDVRKARMRCFEAMSRYANLHQTRDSPEKLEQARAMLHTSVIDYWNAMKRFSNHPRIYELWHEDPITEGGITLEEIRNRRFTESTGNESVYDPETNSEEEQQVRQPWRLHPRQALAVHDRLDDCLHKLGVDQQWITETRERFKSSKSTQKEPVSDNVKKPQ